jgi:hypothetical protein
MKEFVMSCRYCDDEWFGGAKQVLNADRRIKSPRGDVHARCLAYLFIELGIESAFGEVTSDEHELIMERFNLPTRAHDQLNKTPRWRLHKNVEKRTGIKGPMITYPMQDLVRRLERRSDQVGHEAERVAEALDHLDRARALLGDLPF